MRDDAPFGVAVQGNGNQCVWCEQVGETACYNTSQQFWIHAELADGGGLDARFEDRSVLVIDHTQCGDAREQVDSFRFQDDMVEVLRRGEMDVCIAPIEYAVLEA